MEKFASDVEALDALKEKYNALKFEIQKGNNSEALRRVMQNRLLLPTANAT